MRVTLKAARVNANMSQAVAAKALGVGESTLAKWESGDTCPRADRMHDICDLYGCQIDDIIFLPTNYGKTVN
ncbi:MAG: helix-turn-helix transcriptional regulator [Oscillospiraceae bacterium]|nr:helix-turn-helix transcriptional regulator [Oscillospiraceae bacterium]